MSAVAVNPRCSFPLSSALEVLEPELASSDSSRAIVAAKCVGLMCGYDCKWLDSPYLIDDVECLLTGDLWNPETGAKSRSFTLAGKLDVRARELRTGARVIIDHKTTSQEIADPNASYWRQLVIEGQVSHYILLEWEAGNKTDYGLWDVVRKPSISPKLLAKKDREVVLATRSYCGSDLTVSRLDEFASADRETPAMYASRLAQDCISERPEWYFQRRQMPRLDSEIREYAMELWGHSKDLLHARYMERHPRNSGACMNYGTPCKYLGICSGHDTAHSEHWVVKPQVHAELPMLEGNGKNVLTNSRVRTFQTCRRKHELQYEIGIERVDEEERESLFFGSLFHQALEQYFLALKKQQQGVTR